MFGVKAGRLGEHASLLVVFGKPPRILPSMRLFHPAGTMDLEDRALRQFDKLVESGELLWAENEVRVVEAEPFNARNVLLSSTTKLKQG